MVYSAANRRKLDRLMPGIEEALRTENRAGFEGGLDPDEMEWLAHQLKVAWIELALVDLFHARDRKRLRQIIRRLERAR